MAGGTHPLHRLSGKMRLLAKIQPLFFTFVLLWALVLAPVCMVRGMHASGAVDSHTVWGAAEHHHDDDHDDHDDLDSDDHDHDAHHDADGHISVEASDEDGLPTTPVTMLPPVSVLIAHIVFHAPDEGLIRVLFERAGSDAGPPRDTHGVGALPLLT